MNNTAQTDTRYVEDSAHKGSKLNDISGLDILIPLERSRRALQDGGNRFLIGQLIFA